MSGETEAARAGGLRVREERGLEAVACPLVLKPLVVPAGNLGAGG